MLSNIKIVLYFLMIYSSILAASEWKMLGAVNTFEVKSNSKIAWLYRDNIWFTNQKNYSHFLNKINRGEAYWCYCDNRADFDLAQTQSYARWHKGWNFVAPIYNEWNLNKKFGSHLKFAWRYGNGIWMLYFPGNENSYNFVNFDTLSPGEGAWLYIDAVDIFMSGIPVFCENGICSDMEVPTNNYIIKLKSKTGKTGLKIGAVMQRDGSEKIYKFGVGPFSINVDGTIKNERIAVCVESSSSGSDCRKEPAVKFLDYEDGYVILNGAALANFFIDDKPDIVEKLTNTTGGFKMSIYSEGFDLKDMTSSDEAFGTIGIEGFGTYVKIGSKRVSFHITFHK